MTRDEALKLALEALEDNQHLIADKKRHVYVMEYNSIIEKCKEALAQPEVFWIRLTEEEIHASKPPISNDAVVWELAVAWAETKLKEKNT